MTYFYYLSPHSINYQKYRNREIGKVTKRKKIAGNQHVVKKIPLEKEKERCRVIPRQKSMHRAAKKRGKL